jgi:hypothetical protein
LAKWGSAMKYVYILESHDSEDFYAGITDDLRATSEAQCGRGPPYLEIPALAVENLCRVQRRKAGHRLREILEVRLRPGICEEASVMLNGFDDASLNFARNAHDD